MSRKASLLLILSAVISAWFILRPGEDRDSQDAVVRLGNQVQQERFLKNRDNPDDKSAGPFIQPGEIPENAWDGENEDGDEDYEIINEGLAKQFVFATPGSASSSGPVATLVAPERGHSSTNSPSKRTVDDDGNPAEPDPPELEALEELSRLSGSERGRTSLIGGARVRRDSGSPSELEGEETTTSDEEEDDEILPRVGGQARGFTILALMHPDARESVEKQIEIMIRSQVRNLYIGFLVDGTFSTDFEYASTVVQRLSSDGRSLMLQLYFLNGPTMRRFETTPIEAPFTSMDPLLFRAILMADPAALRTEIRRIIEAAKPLFVQNRYAGPENQNLACVMLEDNLDVASYRVLRSMISSSLGDLATFVRNPCPGCYKGNDEDPDGDILETHAPERLAQLRAGDGLTFDGSGYSYPGESDGGTLSIDEVKRYLEQAASRKIRYVGLWRADRQGLGDQSMHPDERVYAVPTEAQAEYDIEVLRTGLNQE